MDQVDELCLANQRSIFSHFNSSKRGSAELRPPADSCNPPVPDECWSDSSDEEGWSAYSSDEELSTDQCDSEECSDDSESDGDCGGSTGPTHAEAGREECRESEDDCDKSASFIICTTPFCTYNLNGLSPGSVRFRFIAANLVKLAHTYRGGDPGAPGNPLDRSDGSGAT